MVKRPSFSQFKARALKNVQIKSAHDDLKSEFDLIEEFIKARRAAKLSQQELAKRLATKQPAIARLERQSINKATVATLRKYAEAVGCTLKITLEKRPLKHHTTK